MTEEGARAAAASGASALRASGATAMSVLTNAGRGADALGHCERRSAACVRPLTTPPLSRAPRGEARQQRATNAHVDCERHSAACDAQAATRGKESCGAARHGVRRDPERSGGKGEAQPGWVETSHWRRICIAEDKDMARRSSRGGLE